MKNRIVKPFVFWDWMWIQKKEQEADTKKKSEVRRVGFGRRERKNSFSSVRRTATS
jgi:hypothetical protein